jgi:hypothetical protein
VSGAPAPSVPATDTGRGEKNCRQLGRAEEVNLRSPRWVRAFELACSLPLRVDGSFIDYWSARAVSMFLARECACVHDVALSTALVIRAVIGGSVPGAGLEPARPLGQRLLRPPRLPFRHPGRSASLASLGVPS